MARGIRLDMNWLSLQARKGCPLGLKNLGNSCYLNSVLQCLTYTPPLANFCLRNYHSSSCTFSSSTDSSICLFCLVEKRIARSLNVDSVSESPARIHSCLSLFAKHFREGWQEDAHEFLRYVIEACNNVCVKLHKILSASKLRTRQDSQKLLKEEPHTVVKEIFGGILQSQVKCLTCKAESNKLDEMMDLSLDVFKLASLKDALCRYFQPEVLDGSNKYKCDRCKKLTAARKQMSVSQAPNVLVIQLKRFENFFGGKIDRYISFEEDLDLHSHMCQEGQDRRPEYRLYGVIVHAGYSQDSGHYYSYVKDSHGKWFCCNDAHVTSVTTKSVLSEKAYVLFYVRKSIKSAVSDSAVIENGHVTSTVKENGKVAVSLKELAVKENGVTEKANIYLTKLSVKESGVTESAVKHSGATELTVKENGATDKSSSCPKELFLKENGVTQSSNISSGSVQQVRFNIVKSGSNCQPRKFFGNEHRQTGHGFKDQTHSKRQTSANLASSDGNKNKADLTKSIMKTAVLNNQELEKWTPSAPVGQLHDCSSNESSHTLSRVKENVPPPEAPPSEDEGQIKVLSNGSYFGSLCPEEVQNSKIHGIEFQPAPVQKLGSSCLSADECKRKEKPDRVLCSGGLTGKLLDRSSILSKDVGVELGCNHEARITSVPLDGSDRDDLELRLAAESRKWLLQSGWCDTVRNSFRHLKRARPCQNANGIDDKRKTLRVDMFASVHDSLRQKVPKELKEHLVKQLQEYFAFQNLKPFEGR